MTTERAVYLMVNAAWRQLGGTGKTAAVIIRGRQTPKTRRKTLRISTHGIQSII